MNLVIIGAGNAAVTLLGMFSGMESIKIREIVDIKNDAPGMLHARKLGINTSNNMENAVKNPQVDMIVEVTGSQKIRDMIKDMMRPEQELLSASGAKIMCDMLDGHQAKNAQMVNNIGNQFGSINSRLGTAISSINNVNEDIMQLLKEAEILAVNGMIEATRAGDAGAAFAVVVGRMQDMIKGIKKAINNIENASEEGEATLHSLKQAEDQLREEFSVA